MYSRIDFAELKIGKKSLFDSFVKDEENHDSREFLSVLFSEIFAEIGSICKPSFLYEEFDSPDIQSLAIAVNGIRFDTGPVIAKALRGAEKAFLFTATAGEEFDKYLHDSKKDILKHYMADLIGSEIPEAVNRMLGKKLEHEMGNYGMTLSYPYSPGYCGWNVAEQHKLFSLLPPEPCGIVLNSSSLMSPIKSVSGIYVAGKNLEKRGYGCSICTMEDCIKKTGI
jgi:hypothetical protein